MKIKARELVDLIMDKNTEGVRKFVEILRQKVKEKLYEEGMDVYELSVRYKIKYNILSDCIHMNQIDNLCFEDLFKLVDYLNK